MDFDQGINGDGVHATSAGRREPVMRDRMGRLPAGTDGRPLLGFATLSHSNLKSWARVEAAQGHNTRTKNTPNARKDAPQPVELLDERSGSYVDRVKDVLREHAVPVKIRKGGTIACEDVYGASPEYWNRNGDWKLKPVDDVMNDPVVQAALALARRKHGSLLVSCSLHLDEESPHVHVISVPLVHRAHAKRGRKPKATPRDEQGKPLEDARPLVLKWSLDVSSIRGLSSKLEKNHDQWAEVCKPYGLVRGARGSDMTEAERRARRNRQTGRASLAEKDAREQRQHLHEEAERSRNRAADHERRTADLKKDAAAKAEEAEADRLAAKLERDIAEAAVARSRSLEEENERIRSVLAKDEEKLAAEKKALEGRANALARESDTHRDQMRFIARALEPTSPVELFHQDGKPQVRGLDASDWNGVRGNWAWLPGGIEALAKRITRLAVREADAEKVQNDREALNLEQDRHRVQLSVLEKALDPSGGLSIEKAGSDIRLIGVTEQETVALKEAPSWLKSGIERIIAGVRSVADRAALLDQRIKNVEERDAILRGNEDLFDEKASLLQRTLAHAMQFRKLWDHIPSSERSPAVNSAISVAEGLTTDDLPPGFTLPGRGGASR
ncbi:hypothetical protein M2336_002666 [Sphingobium sp. B1D7B]|uniref:plasmid recombination protein n=1 Tax=Sphingobium sp. B1D7B TaxID=2940578 RepID=UPI0022246ECB|nr:plasmid recombination protein [Sphingobium sp. B1D7B]MCW2406037.1 hypothetical protein [Sphingobium sp. B1D7B]